MRIVNTHEGSGSSASGTTTCASQSCTAVTREGKPFCPVHVEDNPHAEWVVKQISDRAEEDAVVARGDTPVSGYNIKGLTSQAILQQLSEYGTRTKPRLCRELTLDRAVLDGYVEALLNRGLVVEGMTNRGTETLALRRRPLP